MKRTLVYRTCCAVAGFTVGWALGHFVFSRLPTPVALGGLGVLVGVAALLFFNLLRPAGRP